MDLARRANPPMLASVIEATGSSGFRRGRPTEHLRVIYGLSRADCIAGRFSPSAEAPASGRPFGQLARGTGSRCTDGVGLGIHGSYSGAAAHSIGNISAMLPYLESSHSLTLELWLRAPPQPESENAVPIVALGSERSADFDACARGDIGLRLSQNGGYLELELSSAVPIRGRHTCYHVEIDSRTVGGTFFRDSPAGAPQQLMLVIESGKPLRAYQNGERLRDLLLIPSYSDGAIAIEPQFSSWHLDHRLLFAPSRGSGNDWTGWSGEIFLFALYSAALTDEEVRSSFTAWLEDSAPLADARTIALVEDTPTMVMLSGKDPFDEAYSPRPAVASFAEITKLPTSGTLFLPSDRDSNSAPAAQSAAVVEADLPLPLPGGRVWYVPARDVAGVAAVTFEYRVLDGNGRVSPSAQVVLNITSRNDPPQPASGVVDVVVGMRTRFELRASDNDSALSHAVVHRLPSHGRLYAAATTEGGGQGDRDDEFAPGEESIVPLAIGDSLPVGEWALEYEYVGEGSVSLGNEGKRVLDHDSFAFGACDALGACSAVEDSGLVTLRVLNSLVAHPVSAIVEEDTPIVMALWGGRLSVHKLGAAPNETNPAAAGTAVPPILQTDEPLPVRIITPPSHGQLYPCRPALGAQACVAHKDRRTAQAGDSIECECCTPRACSLIPLGRGDQVDAGAKVVYVPARNYFNCATPPQHGGECVDELERTPGPDTFIFEAVDAQGGRSAPEAARLWVVSSDDKPQWTHPGQMRAQMLELTPLPALGISDPDGDLAEWGVQLSVSAGDLTLNTSALPDLRFELGDGMSDRFMYFTGRPSRVAAAFHGATYRAIELRNDSISIAIADPADGVLTHLPSLSVHVTPANALPYDAAVAHAPLSALIATWSLVGVLLCCGGFQLFAWFQRSCHPEEMESRAAERYEVLQEESYAAPGAMDSSDGEDFKAESSHSLRSWAIETTNESRNRKRAKLQRTLKRRGVDMGSGGFGAGRSPSTRTVRLAIQPPPVTSLTAGPCVGPSPSPGIGSGGCPSPTISSPSTPFSAVRTTMLSMIFGPRANVGESTAAKESEPTHGDCATDVPAPVSRNVSHEGVERDGHPRRTSNLYTVFPY